MLLAWMNNRKIFSKQIILSEELGNIHLILSDWANRINKCVWCNSLKAWVQILGKTACVLLHGNALGKDMNSSLFFPVMSKL